MQTTEQQEQPRLHHLKQIERAMVERFQHEDIYRTDAPENYSQMSFEEKNNLKFMATFPYPYMNGYLHLGKFIILTCLGHGYSLSKAEF